jgi:hypothetical protein
LVPVVSISINANFNVEKTEGNTGGNRADDFSNKNKNLPIVNPTDKSSPPISYTGPKNVKAANNKGILGYYFLANNKIRTLKKYEGDLTIESRHGQSIRFSSYDNERKNDIGDSKNPDYKGCGNPMILIRNKQRPLGDEKKERHDYRAKTHHCAQNELDKLRNTIDACRVLNGCCSKCRNRHKSKQKSDKAKMATTHIPRS